MRKLFYFASVILLIFNVYSCNVNASGNAPENMSEVVIAAKYAESICNAKADHFFEGLDNEKALKYSYFRYIGLQSKEIISKEMYKLIIQQIQDKCTITNEEEIEINDFLSRNITQRQTK